MRLMRLIPDILRRQRVPASGPTEFYQHFMNFNIAAGVAVRPLSVQRIQASLAYVQNDNTNLGNLSVGGMNVDINNGIQLGPGQAAVLTAESRSIEIERMVAGSLGAGLMAYSTRLEAADEPWVSDFLGAVFSGHAPRIVINLAEVHVISTLAAQNVRVTYTQMIKVG